MPTRAAALRSLAALGLLVAAFLLAPVPTGAAQAEITSAGPLTRIIIGDELNCQVAHRADADFELFGGELGACGTFLAVDGELFGPSLVPAGVEPTQAWTALSQSAVLGAGSSADPFRIVTVVAAGDTGLRVEQTDSYVVGSEAYRTDLRLINDGGQPRSGLLYRAGDCYLQESDVGYGRVVDGAPGCVTEQASGSRIELWLPLTPGSSYMEGGFGEVWQHVASQQPFPNSCRCDVSIDNGAGLSWPVSVAAGQSAVVSHETFFSPEGRSPAGVSESFRESLPLPNEISLDPLVLAQSVLIAAGVILLMPFPAALFNETLEANYDEIRQVVARGRGWIAGLLGGSWSALRRLVEQRRGPPGGPPPGGWSGETYLPHPYGQPSPAGQPGPLPSAPPQAAGADRPAAAPPTPLTGDFWRTPQGMLAFILPSAIVYSFLDPTFGLSVESLATTAGLAIGLAVVIAAYGVPLLLFARARGIDVIIKALPVTLLVGVLFVLLSRIADFEPGYVYGLVIGALFAPRVSDDQQGRAEAVGAAALLIVAGAAWVSLLALDTGAAGLLGVTIETAAVTTAVAGVEGVLFAMAPLRFMPGQAVFAWNRRVWAVMIGIGAFGFAHVLLNPRAGYLADQTRASFLSMVAVFVGFALFSVAFWAWFRFRPRRVDVGGAG